MDKELTEFLRRNGACSGGIARLDSLGAETLEDAWEKASPTDLVWAVTRPGVMSPEQRRQFLVFVLGSIEDKLTDPRSKNILEKLRTNSPITEDDADAADARASRAAADAYAAEAAADAADAAAAQAAMWAAEDTADSAMWAAEAEAAADAADAAAAQAAMWAAEDTADSAMWAAQAAQAAQAAAAAARAAQARWIRENVKLSDLHIN